jgi:hypothetical protein
MDEIPFWKSNWFIACVLFILVLAVGLRFMSAGLVHYDSVRLAQAVQDGRLDMGRPGMFLLVSAAYLPLQAFGYDADLAVRLTGVLFLALCAAAAYLLAFEMMRSRTGAIAASLLLVATPFFIIPASFGKEHSAALLFIILAAWCALRSHRSDGIVWSLAASLLFIISLSIRELGILALPAFVWLVLMPRRVSVDGKSRLALARNWLPGVVSLAILLVVALALFLFTRIAALLGDQSTAGLFVAWQYLPLAFELVGSTGWQWVAAILGLYAVWRIGRPFVLPLALWFAPIVVIISLGGFYPRYLDIVLVPWVLLVGFAIAWLAHRWFALAMLVMLALVLSTFWLALPLLEIRHEASNLVQFSEKVAALTEPDALIIAFDESAFIEWYGERAGTSLSPTAESKLDDARWLLGLQRNGTPVYVLSSSFDYGAQGKSLEFLLNQNFVLTTIDAFPMENYHDADTRIVLRNVSLIRIGGLIQDERNLSAIVAAH